MSVGNQLDICAHRPQNGAQLDHLLFVYVIAQTAASVLLSIFSKTTEAINSQFQIGIFQDGLCIITRNSIISYFRLTANPITVFILDHVRVAICRQRFQRFRKGLQVIKRMIQVFRRLLYNPLEFRTLTSKIGLKWTFRRLRITQIANFVLLSRSSRTYQ